MLGLVEHFLQQFQLLFAEWTGIRWCWVVYNSDMVSLDFSIILRT